MRRRNTFLSDISPGLSKIPETGLREECLKTLLIRLSAGSRQGMVHSRENHEELDTLYLVTSTESRPVCS